MANPQKTLFKQFDVVAMCHGRSPDDKVRAKLTELRAQTTQTEFLAALDAYWAKNSRHFAPFFESGLTTPQGLYDWIVSYLNSIQVIDTY